MARRQPLFTYAVMIVLGLAPTALVSHYYAVLPNRMVIQWDVLGHMTIIGTRASTVLLVANFAAVAGLLGTAVAFWQHKAFVAIDGLRAFLILNMAQIVAINLTCIMLVTQSLGYNLTIKPMIAPTMAVLLFASGVLFRRAEGLATLSLTRILGVILMLGAMVLLGLNAFASPHVVGYYASAFALLMMVAAAIPARAS